MTTISHIMFGDRQKPDLSYMDLGHLRVDWNGMHLKFVKLTAGSLIPAG